MYGRFSRGTRAALSAAILAALLTTALSGCGSGLNGDSDGNGGTAICAELENPSSPALETLPGRWRMVEPPPGENVTVTVHPDSPDCGYEDGHPSGDACVWGLGSIGLVLDGTHLFVSVADDFHADGQVSEDGRRVELDETVGTNQYHLVYTKL